ncbi:Acyl-CoA-binding domain-containing protein [Paramyrothecium foliicola]|nr:Acyl-CoA-binding domain-containing protein [Paramyrothecium foliicola]
MMNLRRPSPPSPPTLQIPSTARSPSGYSPTANTGRPPLWTKSAQRKMSRLYLYTTLPITKILELIWTDSPHAAPGKDSANKKLNAMLDKEPRWLHPKTSSDMGRRVSELCNSPTRSLVSAAASPGRPHSVSDPTPFLPSAPAFLQDSTSGPSTRNVSPFDEWPASAPASATHGTALTPNALFDHSAQASRGSTASPSDGLGPEQNDLLEDFLRRTTFMSSSTDRTTGSYHRVLSGYPEAYIRTVRRLVKRFTMPNNNHRSVSPIAERPETVETSWIDDHDAPSVFRDRPYPLPGDFLNMAAFTQQSPSFAGLELANSPWVSSLAPTIEAHRILSGNLMRADANARDAFGNTVLHFLAACGTAPLMFQALRSGYFAGILNEKNTAGQTFLHLLTRSWIGTYEQLLHLVTVLSNQGFDLYARDHYGRNFFHILRQEEIDSSHILQHLQPHLYAKRDAFNVVPSIGPLSGSANHPNATALSPSFETAPGSYLTPSIIEDTRLLKYVRYASEHPSVEDEEGRNGLHCLAMTSLSIKKVSDKVSLTTPPPEGQRRRSQGHADNLDSSEERLGLRFETLVGLLDKGVDPNHYDHQGNTPLMAFVAELPEDDDYRTGPRILEALLDRGADIEARNRAGETALHIAVRCGRKLAMRTLVKRNANVYARDAAGRSVLDVADVKMANVKDGDHIAYSHFEACRAWLSGQGHAIQRPNAVQEWSVQRQS